MKVLLINNFFYRKGGSEAVFFNTAELLLRAGHQVVFFSIKDENNIHTKEPEYFVTSGGVLRRLRNYFYNPDAAKELDELLSVEEPDIAHVHLFWGGISPSIFKVLKDHKVPLIHTVHDYRMICPAYTFYSRGKTCERCKGGHYIQCLKNKCSKGSLIQSALMTAEMYFRNSKWPPFKELDGIIYVSNFAKQIHEEFEPHFASVSNITLYNFTAIGDRYHPVEKDGGYYLYFGRLSYEKGVGTMVDAFANFKRIKLIIAGTGPQENELKSKLYSNIEFVGYKTGTELYELVRKARFVCVPSEWYENNPMTIVEAYSMGVPVIGARIGGIPEIVLEGETGFLFESYNVEDLSIAIERSLNVSDGEYQIMKLNARLFAQKFFNSKDYTHRLLSFYDEVCKKKEMELL